MSLSAAYINVICDNCQSEEKLELEFFYFPNIRTTGLYGGMYDHRLPKVNKRIAAHLPEWVVKGDRHFCCTGCWDQAKETW